MIDYLTLSEALAIHDGQIRCYGGAPRVRDIGLLEHFLKKWEPVFHRKCDKIKSYGISRDPEITRNAVEATLFRPQTGYYPDLLSEAAALWESLSQNHPFVDGNKRTGLDLSADQRASDHGRARRNLRLHHGFTGGRDVPL